VKRERLKAGWHPSSALYALFFITAPLLFTYRNVVQISIPLIAIAAAWLLHRRHALSIRQTWTSLRRNRFVLLVPVVGFASILWSVNSLASAKQALQLGFEFAAGFFLIAVLHNLSPDEKRNCVTALVYGLVAASLSVVAVSAVWVLATDHQLWDAEYFNRTVKFDRGNITLAILLVPLTLILIQNEKRGLAAVFVASAALSLLFSMNSTVRLAAAIAAVSAASVYLVPSVRYALYTTQMAIVLLMPLLIPLPFQSSVVCTLIDRQPSLYHRLMSWEFADRHIERRPLLGHGLHASRHLEQGDAAVPVPPDCPSNRAHALQRNARNMPLHPHNAAIQIWLELGMLGAAAFTALLGFATVRAERLTAPRLHKAAFAATSAAAFTVTLVSFGIWQGWFVATLFLIAGTVTLGTGKKGMP